VSRAALRRSSTGRGCCCCLGSPPREEKGQPRTDACKKRDSPTPDTHTHTHTHTHDCSVFQPHSQGFCPLSVGWWSSSRLCTCTGSQRRSEAPAALYVPVDRTSLSGEGELFGFIFFLLFYLGTKTCAEEVHQMKDGPRLHVHYRRRRCSSVLIRGSH